MINRLNVEGWLDHGPVTDNFEERRKWSRKTYFWQNHLQERSHGQQAISRPASWITASNITASKKYHSQQVVSRITASSLKANRIIASTVDLDLS
jgi:hypothetical protein